MSKTIKVKLTEQSIKNAIRELETYKAWVEEKEAELRQRLAQRGATVASIQFARAVYSGVNDVTVRVDDTGSVAVIYAEGEAAVFIEFGSGVKYGYGHPDAAKHGFGPGTWSDGPDGKGHWDDPNGWWLPKEKGGGHSYGNPPAMAMYQAVQAITESVTEIAREVFK